MGANAALVLELAITALQHVTELNQLLVTAQGQGRDVTDDELLLARTKATDALDALATAQRPSST